MGRMFLHPIFGLIGGGVAGLIVGALADCGVNVESVKGGGGPVAAGNGGAHPSTETRRVEQAYQQILEVAASRGGQVLRPVKGGS